MPHIYMNIRMILWLVLQTNSDQTIGCINHTAWNKTETKTRDLDSLSQLSTVDNYLDVLYFFKLSS